MGMLISFGHVPMANAFKFLSFNVLHSLTWLESPWQQHYVHTGEDMHLFQNVWLILIEYANLRFIVMSKDRIQSVIYTFWMAGIVHLLVLTLHSQIMNHIGDFQSSNSYEKIQNDIGLLHNLYNALEIRSDVSTSPFIQQNFK